MMGDGAGGDFQDLMNKAAHIKGEAMKSNRRKFDSWPRFFQNTMFHGDEIQALRDLPLDERITAAQALKEEGNAFFKAKSFFDASYKYEKALSVFKYCKNTHPDWKKRGIYDTDILVRFIMIHGLYLTDFGLRDLMRLVQMGVLSSRVLF